MRALGYPNVPSYPHLLQTIVDHHIPTHRAARVLDGTFCATALASQRGAPAASPIFTARRHRLSIPNHLES